MIRKKNMLVITFRTTTEAIHMEKCCKEEGVPGRLIPVPKSITAGCGMAWSADPAAKEQIRKMMERHQIRPEAMQFCMV